MAKLITAGTYAIPTHLYDGYQVHRAALARGLTVVALPRQVLLAGRKRAVPAEISFTHGVPEGSTVSAVTYAQDRRLRRALVERAGVAVPRGATFTWKSVNKAGRWSAELGYPVVVKEMVGENPARAIRDVTSAEHIVSAFSQLRQRLSEDRAPGSNPLIAGYAATRLGYVLDDDGNEVAPLRTRFLIEKQVTGEVVRALVCSGQVVAAVLLDGENGTGLRDVTDELHEGICQVLVRAAGAVPGLEIATVDAVVDDHTRPTPGQSVLVTEVCERPRSETYVTASADLGNRIGDALLESAARRAGFDLPEAAEELSIRATIEGLRDAAAVAATLPNVVATYGLRLTVEGLDDVEGELTVTCQGAVDGIAAAMELLMAGGLLEDRASCVAYATGEGQ